MKKTLCALTILTLLFTVGCSNYEPATTNTENSTANSSQPTIEYVEPTPTITGFEKFMNDNNLTLTAKDVQYDMVNNLDKEFGLSGYAELDDYYNYGFDDSLEKDYFCIRVEPVDGKYSDSWYIYCHRDSFVKLFEELKLNPQILYLKCTIPKYMYEENMNNMALAESIRW